MSWGLIATAVTVGSSAYSAVKASGAKSNLEDYILPEYYEDPIYKESQDVLKNLGFDMLKGDIPEYYAGIGETGGKEFENYLSLMKGDIEQGVYDSAAATGRSGGVVQSQIAEQVGAKSTEARYADYLRAMEGKQNLLNTGIGVTENVRGSAQQNEAQRSNFNLGVGQLDLNYRKALDSAESDIGAMQGEAYGNLASSITGLLPTTKKAVTADAVSNIDYASILNPTTNTGTKAVETGSSEYKSIIGSIDEYMKKNKYSYGF